MSGPLRVALITEPAAPGLQPDDRCLPSVFAAFGATAVPVPWGTPLAPGDFDAALVRSPWDYFLHVERFLAWAKGVAVPLLNPAPVLAWNAHKGYLLELQDAGVAALPATRLVRPDERPADADGLLAALGAPEAVLKPAVSGGAHRTRIVRPGEALAWTDEDVGDFVAQAFVPAVTREGEWSVTAIDGVLSHAVLKRAKAGDFRVQDEHGGTVEFHPEVPTDLAEAARAILEGAHGRLGLDAPLVQARVDLVRDPGGGPPLLMELELIEPELFLRARPGAPEDLARAVYRASRS